MTKSKTDTTPKATRTWRKGADDPNDKERLSPRKRKRLLARVAGNIASSIVVQPSESTETPDAIAEVAVDLAEAILKKVGI